MHEWLFSIGLTERIQAFQEQEITADQLNELTDNDLRELGLTIGERIRFRRALRERSTEHGPILVAQASQGERRPLTIMFVDLVNSTGLGERLDPEDLIEVIRDYRELCGAAINRFGGHTARFIGDGIMAYFSFPVANENDPERAVRAALGIVAGIGALSDGSGGALKVRIGIATGRVVVSDLFTGGETDKDTIMGSCPNLAARLQSLADANGIVISEQTYERVRLLFTCEPLGNIQLRGFDQPHQPWSVVGEARRQVHGRGPNELFSGRKAELDLLNVLWRKAQAGEGAAVLITGEPGIGKSRLIDHFVHHSLPPQVSVLHLVASAFSEDSPLRPFVDYFYEAASLSPSDSPREGLAKLNAVLLGDDAQKRSTSAVLAGVLRLSANDPTIEKLLPHQLRERTIAVLIDQLLRRAEERPLCVVLDDVQWLDPTSRELVEILLARIEQLRVLVLVSGREEVAAQWSGKTQTIIRLGRMSGADVSEMVHGLFSSQITQRFIDQVASRTDGVPLFVEEVARVLLDQPIDGETISSHVIPSSLDETLAARLDRSGTAKEVAQAAAVAGRSVQKNVLAAVCGMAEAKLDQALTSLVSSGILERSYGAPRETYCFRHVLLRDAAYSSLLRERRRELHDRIASAMETMDAEEVDLHPEIIAHHLTEAGRVLEAAPQWLEAARRILARSALTEAARMLRRAIDALEKLPPEQENLRLRIQLSALLGPALIGLKGPNAAETKELYSTTYEVCRQVPEEMAHFPIYWGWWRLAPASIERAGALLALATERDNPELLLQAHHCNWATHFHVGAFAQCQEHMRAGLSIYHAGEYTHHARLYGNHDAKVCAHGNLCQLFWMQGKLRTAVKEEFEAQSWAAKLDHLGSRVHALGLTLLHRVYRRDLQSVFQRSGELISLTAEHGLSDHGAAGLIFRGWATALEDDPVAGLKSLEDGLARQREVCTNEDFPVYLCLLAEVLVKLGRADEAVSRILQELPDFEACRLQVWMPELLRILGETMLAADQHAIETARGRMEQARELAEAQGVPMLELRAAISLTCLDERIGVFDPGATSHVTSVLDRIVENDGSKELADAWIMAQQCGERS